MCVYMYIYIYIYIYIYTHMYIWLLAVGGLLDLALLRAEGRDGREAPVLPRLALRGLVGRDGLLGSLVRPRQVSLRPPHLRDGVEHVALLSEVHK